MPRSFEFSENQVRNYNHKPLENERNVELIESGFFDNCRKILDIGSGDGKVSADLATKLPLASIVGCDVSKTMVAYAKSHYLNENLSFIEKDATNLDFSTKFDLVVSFSCLHWIKNQKKALEQIFHVLKRGGKAFLTAAPKSKNNDFKTICRNVILSWRWLFYFLTFRSVHSFHGENEYRKVLLNIGFIIDHIEVKQKEISFKDRSELEPFLRAVLTPLQHLPSSKQSSFFEDIFQELHRLGKVDSSGEIHICFDQIEMLLRKE